MRRLRRVGGVVSVENGFRDHRELTPGQHGGGGPGAVQGVVEVPAVVDALVDEPAVELVSEAQVGAVGLGEGVLAEELGELADVAGLGEEGDELGGELEVVVSGAAGPAPRRISRESDASGSIGG